MIPRLPVACRMSRVNASSRGRPPKADAKVAGTRRLHLETVDRFKPQGPDWPARVGEVVKRAAGG